MFMYQYPMSPEWCISIAVLAKVVRFVLAVSHGSRSRRSKADKFLSSFDDLINYISNKIPLFWISWGAIETTHKKKLFYITWFSSSFNWFSTFAREVVIFHRLHIEKQLNLVAGRRIHPCIGPNCYNPIHSVFSCIQTRKNSVFGHFSRSDCSL